MLYEILPKQHTHTHTLWIHIKENQKTWKDPPFIFYECAYKPLSVWDIIDHQLYCISLPVVVILSEWWGSDTFHLLNAWELRHNISRPTLLWLLSFLSSYILYPSQALYGMAWGYIYHSVRWSVNVFFLSTCSQKVLCSQVSEFLWSCLPHSLQLLIK